MEFIREVGEEERGILGKADALTIGEVCFLTSAVVVLKIVDD